MHKRHNTIKGMQENQTIESQNVTIKLLVENALLEQEKRLTSDFRKEMEHHSEKIARTVADQSRTYSKALIDNAKDIATLNEKIKTMKTTMITVGAACGTLGGFVGFIAALIIKG
jgi:hypothetical protein